MFNIYDLYLELFNELTVLSDRYHENIDGAIASDANDRLLRAKRIENLNSQLKKIEDYSEKVDYFQKVAEHNIESKNLLKITPRELNFNRLRNWEMMIDREDTDDQYAQRIYVQCECNKMFLQQKKSQFKSTIKQLESGNIGLDDDLKSLLEGFKDSLVEDCKNIINGDKFTNFAKLLKESCDRENKENKENIKENYVQNKHTISLGSCLVPLTILDELKDDVKSILGESYNSVENKVILPSNITSDEEFVIYLETPSINSSSAYSFMQNTILDYYDSDSIGRKKVLLLDGVHYNNVSLGSLRQLEDTYCLEKIPRSPEQLEDRLRLIVSNFSDIDDELELSDSVIEYNKTNENYIPRMLLVVVGYPNNISSTSKDLLDRIIFNHDRYGISLLLINNISSFRNDFAVDLSSDMLSNFIKICSTKKDTTISFNGADSLSFSIKNFIEENSIQRAKQYIDFKGDESRLGNKYIERVDISSFPKYKKGFKSIKLPYGVNSKDELMSISFDNENFASFLMGASGSGKSTLLHSLITGIINSYHPDDVELWLADFKMSEFAQYIDPMPPHVKYILLDESPELVFDLIDKLTDEMIARQKYFMQNKQYKKVENVPSDIYMPVIFVILDEFSIMSQSIAEDPGYKLKLQNLLAKGRALGIKFLFSSQTFLNGIAGLTPTAKAQIQSRLAMKNSRDEITETLELSAAQKTDQVKNWIDALPPYHTLYKYREDETIYVEKSMGLYFDSSNDYAYKPQMNLINLINDNMRSVSATQYSGSDSLLYVDKHPVVVDGNSFKSFDKTQIFEHYEKIRQATTYDKNDLLLTFGEPRKMSSFEVASISRETRENLCLFGDANELPCITSILLSTIYSCLHFNYDVIIWAYSKNRLYLKYKELLESLDITIIDSMDEICKEIGILKHNIRDDKYKNQMYILLGFDRIYNDFSFNEDNRISYDNSFNNNAVANTDDERKISDLNFECGKEIIETKNKLIKSGKSEKQIENTVEKIRQKYNKKIAELEAKFGQDIEDVKAVENETSNLYDAREDFKYVFKQGSKYGYHFFTVLNSYIDLKSMGIGVDYFGHKLSFRMPKDDCWNIFGNKFASNLPDRICQIDNYGTTYSFRPYLHEGVDWDGFEFNSDK